MRDENSETPANSYDLFNLWSLESITCITLNQRLDLFNPTSKDENGKELVRVSDKFGNKNFNLIILCEFQLVREFFMKSYEFDCEPSIWRFYETKAFKRLIKVYDDMTKYVKHKCPFIRLLRDILLTYQHNIAIR